MSSVESPSSAEVGREPLVTVREVDPYDPYVSDVASEEFHVTHDGIEEIMTMGYYGDASIDLARPRKKIDFDNPATKRLIELFPNTKSWMDMIPTAAALDVLYRPNEPAFPSGELREAEFNKWLCNNLDARGIRNRGTVLREALVSEAIAKSQPEEWLSLASGAAQPVIAAAQAVKENGTPVPHITLVDIDKPILGLARTYAEEAGVAESLRCIRTNVLQQEGIDYTPAKDTMAKVAVRRMVNFEKPYIHTKLPAGAYDVVDAVGILEYLGADAWGKTAAEKKAAKKGAKKIQDASEANREKYEYGHVIKEDDADRPFAGARQFLENSYRLVKPGGRLIVGNMLDTHPQLGFTLNVIQWPHIKPRSIDEVVGLIRQAGIEDPIDVQIPKDGVYAIYTIRKADA